MGPDAGRICIALRLQAVAQRVADMDRTSFADAVCDTVDAAGRLGYLGCLAGLRRQARATDTLDAESFTARLLAALDVKGTDRIAFQTAAMRLADLVAPVSLTVDPECARRQDRAAYSYTCGRCGGRVTVSVCTRCPSCGAYMVVRGANAPVMEGAVHVDS